MQLEAVYCRVLHVEHTPSGVEKIELRNASGGREEQWQLLSDFAFPAPSILRELRPNPDLTFLVRLRRKSSIRFRIG